MTEWIIEDRKFLDISVSLKEMDKFLSADFEIIEINNEKSVAHIREWCKINPNMPKSNNLNQAYNNGVMGQNIILKNKIIKLEKPFFSLRCFAIEIELNVLMAGESSLYIITRGKDEISNEMAICFINKEMESSRKFINFAILEECDEDDFMNIKTLKKQEIPKQGLLFNNLRKLYKEFRHFRN
jgi:hypothetical protein